MKKRHAARGTRHFTNLRREAAQKTGSDWAENLKTDWLDPIDGEESKLGTLSVYLLDRKQ